MLMASHQFDFLAQTLFAYQDISHVCACVRACVCVCVCVCVFVRSCLATKVLIGKYLPMRRVVVSGGWGNGFRSALAYKFIR